MKRTPPPSSHRAIFESVWSGDKLVFHRNQKSAAAATSVADGARNLCSAGGVGKEGKEGGREEGRGEGRGRHACSLATQQKTRNLYDRGREGEREVGVATDDTRDTRYDSE